MILGWVPAWSAVSPRRAPAAGGPTPPYARPIAVVTGLLYALVTLRLGWSAALVPVLVLVAGLVAVSAVDLVCWRIPARFVYLTGLGALAGMVVAALVADETGSLGGAAVGAGAYLMVLGGMHLLAPSQMGFGDVRLGALIGMVVGWLGWDATYPIGAALSWTLFALTLASLVGGVAGAVVLVVRRRKRAWSGRMWREAYPFGPWLCIGAVAAILAAGPGNF